MGNSSITWSSKRQPTVAYSSIEAEYRALTKGAKEAVDKDCQESNISHMNETHKSALPLLGGSAGGRLNLFTLKCLVLTQDVIAAIFRK